MSNAEDVLRALRTLGHDFQVVWPPRSAVTRADIDAAERALGLALRPDHRALIATFGCAAAFAHERVWPRLERATEGPLAAFGIEIFGVARDIPPAIDVVVQSHARMPDAGRPLVAALGLLGCDETIGYDASGRLFTYASRGAPMALPESDLLAMLCTRLAQLVRDKDAVKSLVAAEVREKRRHALDRLDDDTRPARDALPPRR